MRLAVSHAEPLIERTNMCMPWRLKTSAEAATTSPALASGGRDRGSTERSSRTVAAATTMTR